MDGMTRYFIVGRKGNKDKTLFSTSNEEGLREFVRTLFIHYMKEYATLPSAMAAFETAHRYTYIVDWQDRKLVSLLQYAQEQNII